MAKVGEIKVKVSLDTEEFENQLDGIKSKLGEFLDYCKANGLDPNRHLSLMKFKFDWRWATRNR